MSNDIHGTHANSVTRKFVTLSAALLVGLFAVTVQAFPELSLEVEAPDLFSAGISVDYSGTDAGGLLTANGFASRLEGAGDIAGGSFNVNADINRNAQTASGTVSIGGTIAGAGFNSGTLLTGFFSSTETEQTFGANGDTGALEFLFNVTGGDAAALYGGVGSTAGIILSQTGYMGSFNGGFGTQFTALADTFGVGTSVPIPGTLWLIIIGGGLLLSRRQKVINSRA